MTTIPKLFEYQRDLALRLAEVDAAWLVMGMGLGKSAITASAITDTPALIVAPKLVAATSWPQELATWRPDFTTGLALGTPAQRKAVYDSRPDVIVTSRDLQHEALPLATAGHFQTLVIDESSAYRATGTKRFKTAAKLAKAIPRRYALTGTPMPTSPLDVFGQVALLDRGQRFGTAFTRFRDRYAIPSATAFVNGRRITTAWEVPAERRAEIEAAVADLVVTTDRTNNDLPPVHTVQRPVQLPPAAKRLYNELRRELVAEHPNLDAPLFAASAGVLSLRLQQVSAGAVKDLGHIHAAKLDMAEEMLTEELSPAEPAIIVYHFKDDLARLRQRFPGIRDAREPGAIEGFNANEFRLLALHPMSAGHGVSLQHSGARHLIWLTPTFSHELYAQTCARLARTGARVDSVISTLLIAAPIDTAAYLRATQRGDDEAAFLAAMREA